MIGISGCGDIAKRIVEPIGLGHPGDALNENVRHDVLGANTNRLLVDVGWPNTLPKLLAMLKRKDISFLRAARSLLFVFRSASEKRTIDAI